MKHDTKPRLLFVLCASLAPAARAACYYPDGTLNTKQDYQPCRSSTPFTMCCATNRTTPDSCELNGLCTSPQTNGVQYWRESCTDPTWKSPYCLQNLCASSAAQLGNDGQVAQCPDGSWCCNTSGTDFVDCCNKKKGVQLPVVIGVSSTPTTSGAGPGSTGPAAPVNGNASGPAADQSTPPSVVGREVGIGLGSAAAAFLISGILAFLYIRKLKDRQSRAHFGPLPTESEQARNYGAMKYDPQQYAQAVHELHTPQQPSEMYEPHRRPELQ